MLRSTRVIIRIFIRIIICIIIRIIIWIIVCLWLRASSVTNSIKTTFRKVSLKLIRSFLLYQPSFFLLFHFLLLFPILLFFFPFLFCYPSEIILEETSHYFYNYQSNFYSSSPLWLLPVLCTRRPSSTEYLSPL